jgi:serine/threonine-protein kinase
LSDVLSRLSAALADRYSVERELGHGGMATVYLSRDLKHRRMVAVKVLRPELAASIGSGRFLHEIEIAAQLQHPHILPLLDSGEAHGLLYYVMPYVEGESLRDRLARKGELPVSDAVRTLAEVADALAYAHSRNVVHRDMKPENIMLSGRHSLVMDFGIAKAVSPASSQQVTTEGVALGTPAYMAPEQAAADPHLDHRVDIYALGVIGYEVLTGSTPFSGASPQQTLAAHITQKPEPISIRRPAVPPGLAAVIMQCLEKRPADRPQSADEILRVLEAMITPGEGLTPTGSRPVPQPQSRNSRRAVAMGGGVLVIAVAGLLWVSRSTPGSRPVPRHSQVTFVGTVQQQEISPDGQLLAYVERGDSLRLFVQDLTGGSIIPIATLSNTWEKIRWSPDGTSILHFMRRGEWMAELLPRLGGQPRPVPSRGSFGVLSPDGVHLASWFPNPESPITLTTLGTNTKRQIVVPKEVGFKFDGDWSPDGHFIALHCNSAAGDNWMLWIGDLRTEKWYRLLADTLSISSPRWSAAGQGLYYLHQNELRKILTTPDGRPRGAPEVLQTGLEASSISLTKDGRKLSYLKKNLHSNLWLATGARDGARFHTVQLTQGTTQKLDGRLSEDGRLIAFVRMEQGQGDVFVVPSNGGMPRRVTSSGVASSTPAWSTDGRQLAFVAAARGSRKIRTVPAEGGEERIYQNTDASGHLVWAPYENLLYQRPGNRNFHWLDLKTEAERPLVDNDSVGWILSAYPAPDGDPLVVLWNRRPWYGLYLISPVGDAQTPMGPNEIIWPGGWSRDGRWVYGQDNADRILRISARGKASSVSFINPFKDSSCDMTERGSSLVLLCNVEESKSDVWMIENFDSSHRLD